MEREREALSISSTDRGRLYDHFGDRLEGLGICGVCVKLAIRRGGENVMNRMIYTT